jgi:uncharacterized membrane protein
MKIKKLLIKAIIYRILSYFIALGITYLFTQNFEISLLMTIVINSVKTIYYYSYDLLWKKITKKS